ncbi:hypothetical protein KCP74_25810 (plasmid) [Salmonella enterica subsp. enterica]|nr:hypothetical protein KCP74_25810 [Salmonella enterica subsp. enterica]
MTWRVHPVRSNRQYAGSCWLQTSGRMKRTAAGVKRGQHQVTPDAVFRNVGGVTTIKEDKVVVIPELVDNVLFTPVQYFALADVPQ